VLLAGEPGIGKSTLLLQLGAAVTGAGRDVVVASGEESRAQVAARARRLGLDVDGISFTNGRDLVRVVEAVRLKRPTVLVIDSIQTLREVGAPQLPGGVAQVRMCTDALVGLAKETGTSVVMAGHVTKDGDLAGPRALEHAVDVVLAFDGDPGSGLRVLSAGKNRFGAEGETAWFEMSAGGLAAIDPTHLLLSDRPLAGAAIALVQRGRRAFAAEIQALVGSGEGPGRRHATGLDLRRFQLVAAVLDRLGVSVGRAELFGAAPGGVRVDDPACDLAVAAALASAWSAVPAPEGTAFVGEVALTGQIRPASAMPQRLQAARAAGCRTVIAAPGHIDALQGVRIVAAAHVVEAVGWALRASPARPKSLPA
jgi:DNA repair protein RadA/Sms